MKVTLVRSTVSSRCGSLALAVSQHCSTSQTHAPASLPSSAMHRWPAAVALKPRCEGNRVIMGLYHLPATQPAWTRREPGGAHENPETIIRPTALDLST